MRRSATLMLGAFALLSVGAARAGTLYVCEGPNGVKAYQDTPCPTKAKTVGTGTLKSTPYAPAPVRDAAPPAAMPDYTAAPPQQVASAPAPQPVGWICETAYRRWLQFSPCPATYMRASSVDVNGFIVGSGAPVHGTGTVGVPTPVQSTPLDRNGVCATLGDHSVRIHHTGSSDVYERNKLKAEYCSG